MIQTIFSSAGRLAMGAGCSAGSGHVDNCNTRAAAAHDLFCSQSMRPTVELKFY
jgi:hypothetical protein